MKYTCSRTVILTGKTGFDVTHAIAVEAQREPEQHKRITDCTDRNQLLTWLRKSPTVNSVSELFD